MPRNRFRMGSPLPDSNRRPLPYHGRQPGNTGNRRSQNRIALRNLSHEVGRSQPGSPSVVPQESPTDGGATPYTVAPCRPDSAVPRHALRHRKERFQARHCAHIAAKRLETARVGAQTHSEGRS